jgi:hypothetical protein
MTTGTMTHQEQSVTGKKEGGETGGIPEIHAHEALRRYKLIDLDNSEIERTAAELVEGSKLLNNRDLWLANFRATIQRVRAWCEESPGVRMALVDIRSNKVLFYFVPESNRYDLELGGRMTALEVELDGSAGIGYVETLQVPERSLDRFAGPRSLLVWTKAPAAAV